MTNQAALRELERRRAQGPAGLDDRELERWFAGSSLRDRLPPLGTLAVAAVGIFSAGTILALVALYAAFGPPVMRYQVVPKPTPTEQTVMTVLGECDRMGCVPAYGVQDASQEPSGVGAPGRSCPVGLVDRGGVCAAAEPRQ